MDYRKKLEKERDKISKTIKEMEDNTLFGDTINIRVKNIALENYQVMIII